MDGALIVSATEKGRAYLRGLLEAFPMPVRAAASAGEARRMLLNRPFALVVVNAPLPDEMGRGLAHELGVSGMGALLIVKNEQREEIAEQLAETGVWVMGKPFAREAFHQAVGMILAANRRVAELREENDRLRRRLEDERTIGRAKMALMQAYGMTEAEAHRAIEKRAMDGRIARREVARDLLRELPMD